MSAIRVLLVDDHQVVREGLRRMLDLEHDMTVVGEASSLEEALAQVETTSPDVVLMDIKMPGGDGIEATRRLKEVHPGCNIIVLTLYEEYLTQAVQAGAVGYLMKDVKREELSEAIRTVHRGQSAMGLSLGRELFAEFVTKTKDPIAYQSALSERETAMLRLIASGATTKEIAAQLYMSDATVKRGVRRIFEKLEVRNRSEAVSEAHKRHLL
ncbi:MAG: response regulator [Dehalococcoidia bacterium]